MRSLRHLVGAMTAALLAVAAGAGAQSAAALSAPDAPTAVTVASSETSFQVRWTAPASDGGSAITSYTATAYTDAVGGSAVSSCSPSTTNCVMTGLTAGTTYYVGVTATNAVGTGVESARTSALAGSVPGTPRSVTVSRLRTGGLAVSWSAPTSDGGVAITSYTASAYTSKSAGAAAVATCSTSGLSCDIAGLDSATVFYVNVHASNPVGTGPDSSFVTAGASGPPTAPQNVTVTRGDGFGLVKWSAPESTGGSAVTRYVAEAFTVPTGGDRIASCEPLTLSSRQCHLGPLPNGGTYYVSVTVYTAISDGVASTPRIEYVPAAAPGVPREVTAQRVGGAVEVTWRAPESDGGLAIESYVASAYPTATGGVAQKSCTTTGPSCQILGLSGAPVYVDVVAKTAAGTSAASSPRIRVRVLDAVDAPLLVAGSARPEGIAVTWLPPLDDGGRPVLGYQARAFTMPSGGVASSSCDLPATKPDTAAGHSSRIGCTVGNLKPNAIYYLEVAATTEAGTTVTSERAAVRVRAAAPLAPRMVTAMPAYNQLEVVWALPASDGGSPVTQYRVQAFFHEKDETPTSECTSSANATASVFRCNLKGLLSYEPYWIAVSAKNAHGWGAASARLPFEAKPSVPGAPQRVQAMDLDHALGVRWERPYYDGGYPVYSYVATAYSAETGGSAVGSCAVSDPDPLTSKTSTTPTYCTITGLTEDTYVYLEVTAENTVGVGAPSPRSGEAIVPGPPAPPSGVTATAAAAKVKAAWSPASVTAPSTVTGYRVHAYATATSTELLGTCATIAVTKCSIAVPRGTVIGYVDVAAQSDLGWGMPSTRVKVAE